MMRSLFLLGCFAAAGAFAMPTKSVKLTVSGYTGEETLANFPVAVRLTAATPGFDYTKCQPDGAVWGSPEQVFRNPEHGNCRLKRDSPAVNAGTPLVWMAGATDLRGDQRLRGEAPDIGAYEHQLNGLRLLVR